MAEWKRETEKDNYTTRSWQYRGENLRLTVHGYIGCDGIFYSTVCYNMPDKKELYGETEWERCKWLAARGTVQVLEDLLKEAKDALAQLEIEDE